MRSGAGKGLATEARAGISNRCAALLLLSTALTTGIAGVANAQAPGSNARVAAPAAPGSNYNFSIPPQPLAGAISAFSRVTGIDVVGDGGIGRGVQSPGVSGNLTPRQALTRLLAGTGLSYRFTNASTVAIQRPNADGSVGAAPAGAISLDTIDVQGETAWGPVQGFVASRSATATKTDTPVIEVPQSISVVTRDQMQTRNNQYSSETLQYTPGVYADRGGNQTGSSVTIRGFIASAYQGSVYLNGLRSLTTNNVDPYGLERVEVMRGPASVLYGQNAPGGVIGHVTKRPTEKPVHEVQLQGGSFDRKGGAFDFGGPVTNDNTLLYRFTGLIRESGNGIDFSNDRRAFVSGAVTWRPTDATEITAFSIYQKDNYRANYGLPAQGTVLPNPNGRIPVTRFIGEPNFSHRSSEMAVVGYNLEHRATDSVTFRQNLQYAHEGYNTDDVAPSGLRADLRTLDREAYRSRFSWDTFVIDNQAELKATTGALQHTVLVGVGYRWRKSAETGTYDGVVGPLDVFAPVYGSPVFIPADNYGPRQTQNFTGIYLQDQIKLDRWILTLGGRYDWSDSKTTDIFDLNGTVTSQNDRAFTKRAGLGYEFDIGVVPYISYAESFVPTSGTAFDGSPFKPTTGTQHEAGIKYQPKDMNLRMTAAVYDLRQQNVLTADPDHPRRSIQTGEIASRGFEFEAVTSLTSNLNLTAAYSYNDVRVTKSNDANLGKRPVTAPPHLASVWADYTIREGALNGLGLGGGLRYIAASAGDSLNTFDAPAYTVVDAMVRYEIDNWRFSVNATNVFNNHYVAGCFSTTQCNVGRTRTVIGTMSYRW